MGGAESEEFPGVHQDGFSPVCTRTECLSDRFSSSLCEEENYSDDHDEDNEIIRKMNAYVRT